eukprot:14015607-Heterocapsa_arctica.AAC.1
MCLWHVRQIALHGMPEKADCVGNKTQGGDDGGEGGAGGETTTRGRDGGDEEATVRGLGE